MNNKLFKSIILVTHLGTITLFGSLYYKLKKEHRELKTNYDDLSRIEYTIKIQKNDESINFGNIKRENIKKIVEDFYKRLSKEQNIDLTIFKNNLKTLNFKNLKESSDYKLYSADALYNYFINTIYYSSMVKPRILAHELLHMSSTIYDKDTNGIKFGGFSQEKMDESIGIGLTEGYTELLAIRLYKDKDSIKGISDAYVVETNFMRALEKIVGQEKMIKLYFSADLKGLINEMKRYSKLEEIAKFIRYLDNMAIDLSSKNERLSKHEYSKYLKYIFMFLMRSYINKLKYEIYNGKITTDEFEQKIDDFLNNLNSFKYLKNGKYHVIELFGKNDILNVIKQLEKEGMFNISSDFDSKSI